jgi:molybdenum cofactor biosynthesis enzyme MoaA
MGEDLITEIKKITLCGNDGDPIYCNELIQIIQWIKKINPTLNIVLITNGSHKKTHWWEELGATLNEFDEIHFSLDGYDQSSNEIYRINSDWVSIINGITSFNKINSNTYKVWASIAFKFNEDKTDIQLDLARTYKFDCYQMTLSTKFGSKYPSAYPNDELEPSGNLIPSGHRFERHNTILSEKVRFSESIKEIYKEKIKTLEDPKLCFIGNKGLFLNSHGEFYPCCWVANRYEHNKEWIELGKTSFNLHKHTFKEILNNEFWCTDFLKFDNLECRTKCNNCASQDESYLLEW